MEDFKSWFYANAAQFWTLASVIVGGIITYWVTYSSEKRRFKLDVNVKKINDVKIPLCSTVEEVIDFASAPFLSEAKMKGEDVRNYNSPDGNVYSNKSIDDFFTEIRKPLAFIRAEKRSHLSQTTRMLLESYKASVDELEATLIKEEFMISSEYRQFLEGKLLEKRLVSPFMFVYVRLNKDAKSCISKAILLRDKLKVGDFIKCIDFVKNDEPERYDCLSVAISNKSWETYGEVEYGATDYDDLDNTEQIAYRIIEVIKEYEKEAGELFFKSVDKTTSATILATIREILQRINSCLISEIDRIA